jgi:hypothetical protein
MIMEHKLFSWLLLLSFKIFTPTHPPPQNQFGNACLHSITACPYTQHYIIMKLIEMFFSFKGTMSHWSTKLLVHNSQAQREECQQRREKLAVHHNHSKSTDLTYFTYTSMVIDSSIRLETQVRWKLTVVI